jgi:hypothetical protein
VLSGVSLDSTTKMLLGWFPAVSSLLLVIWDIIGWRLPGLQRLTHRPRIDGLWAATLQPTIESQIPDGGNRGPILAYLVVSQSYWSLHARQLTEQSSSDSRSFYWSRPTGAEVDRLTFLYENTPHPEHRSRSPRHQGLCSLEVARLKPKEVQGMYFTDRYTQGSMELRLVDRSKGYASFREAGQHVGAA